MVQIITSNKTLLGQSRNRYFNRPSRYSFDFYRLVVGNTTYKRNWFISFNKITPATTAFISTPPLCRCQQEPGSNIAWF